MKIGECEVTVGANFVTTVFPDGHALHAHPQFGEEHVARARALGYEGDDVDAVEAMTRDHDVIHSLVAEARGESFSPVLYAAAHGRSFEGDDEERIVFLIQRLLNQGRSW